MVHGTVDHAKDTFNLDAFRDMFLLKTNHLGASEHLPMAHAMPDHQALPSPMLAVNPRSSSQQADEEEISNGDAKEILKKKKMGTAQMRWKILREMVKAKVSSLGS